MEYKKYTPTEPQRYIAQSNQRQTNNLPPQEYGFILRKAEKLTTALYLVTDILPEKEPMKWKARETGVDILSDVTVVTSATLSEKLSVLRVVLKKIDKVISFLDIASSTRMISEMNASMLKKEYLALRDGIEVEWSRTQERSKTILGERFFEVQEDLAQKIEEGQNTQDAQDNIKVSRQDATFESDNFHKEAKNSIAQRKEESRIGTSSVANNNFMHTPRKVEPSEPLKSTEKIPTHAPGDRNVVAPHASLKQVSFDRDVVLRARTDVTRDDRRKIILALIKQKPAITVADISKSIPGISEKTIQRELLSMVTENILIKRGERRWSTYALRDT